VHITQAAQALIGHKSHMASLSQAPKLG